MTQMKKACVIGSPISHSLSPRLHSYWIKKTNIKGSYGAREILPEQLQAGVKSLINEGFEGFNITIPHKETLLPLLDAVDDVAKHIGAVNTVVIRNAKTYGTNTDAFGFIENIKIHTPDYFSKITNPIILGAGGAARAVVKALSDAGARSIDVVVRDTKKAESLGSITGNLNIHAWDSLPILLSQASLLVNTTPIGMQGKESVTIDLSGLSKEALVTDIVYNPLMTPLLQTASQRGNKVIDGLGMLIFQAIPGFESWFGKRPEIDLPELQQLKQILASV